MPSKDPIKRRKHWRDFYNRNKAQNIQRVLERRKRKRAEIAHYKESHPCTDCGGFFPACVMDFDHMRGTKMFDVSDRVDWSADKLQREIEKCELVCSNCHRIRTYHRRKQSPLV